MADPRPPTRASCLDARERRPAARRAALCLSHEHDDADYHYLTTRTSTDTVTFIIICAVFTRYYPLYIARSDTALGQNR